MRTNKQSLIIRGMVILLTTSIAVHAEESVSELWAESLQAETDGNYVKALEIHEQILPEAGKSYLCHLRAGWLYYQNGDYVDALKHYEKAAGLTSGAVSPLLGAMNCHVAKGSMGQATKAAKAVLVIDGLNYTANLQLASINYQDKKFPLAASYYRKLHRLYPEDLAVASGLAWSYLEQGEARRAMPLFEAILMVSPDYAYAERGLEICNRITNR